MRCYLMSVSRPSPTKIQKQHLLKEMRRKGNPPTLLGNVNWYSHYGEKYGGSLKTKNWATISSVHALSCVRLCNPMNRSMPGLPVHHQLPEFTQTHGHRVHPAISSSVVPFSSCPQSLPASGSFPMSQFSHEVAEVLEFQLQHQSFQWTPRTDLL